MKKKTLKKVYGVAQYSALFSALLWVPAVVIGILRNFINSFPMQTIFIFQAFIVGFLLYNGTLLGLIYFGKAEKSPHYFIYSLFGLMFLSIIDLGIVIAIAFDNSPRLLPVLVGMLSAVLTFIVYSHLVGLGKKYNVLRHLGVAGILTAILTLTVSLMVLFVPQGSFIYPASAFIIEPLHIILPLLVYIFQFILFKRLSTSV